MNKMIKILIALLIINVITLVSLEVLNYKLTKNIEELENEVTLIDEGGGES